MGGGGAFGSAAWGAQDAWALTASPAPQYGDTPLYYALMSSGWRAGSEELIRAREEVAKVLREAGAIE